METAKSAYLAIGDWLAKGKFKANPVTLGSRGLQGIPEGIQLLKEGKVRQIDKIP